MLSLDMILSYIVSFSEVGKTVVTYITLEKGLISIIPGFPLSWLQKFPGLSRTQKHFSRTLSYVSYV